jgi:very-short-patch-repair endonuclease
VPVDHLIAVRVALAAVGGNTVASHQSAAWLQGLIERPPAVVHVTADRARRDLAGVVVHRSNSVAAEGHRGHSGQRRFRGVACTPPARTLVDLAANATRAELEAAVDRAVSAGLVRRKDLVALTRDAPGGPGGRRGLGGPARLGRSAGRRGTDRLRRCLEERGDLNAPMPSVLETKMARLMTRYRLPAAKAEHIAGADGEFRIDYAYPESRVAVELYGYAWHHSPEQLARDQARHRQLQLEGWTVLVFTWPDVIRRPEQVARDVRQALQTRSKAPQMPKSETLKS